MGHGRIEQRTITLRPLLQGYNAWPGLAQVFRLERRVWAKRTGVAREPAIVYGLTSLAPTRTTPAQVLELARVHWYIENKNHWVRDVTFDEDRSQVRVGHLPQFMALVRQLALGLHHLAGERNIAAASRRMAAQPWVALARLGILPEN